MLLMEATKFGGVLSHINREPDQKASCSNVSLLYLETEALGGNAWSRLL